MIDLLNTKGGTYDACLDDTAQGISDRDMATENRIATLNHPYQLLTKYACIGQDMSMTERGEVQRLRNLQHPERTAQKYLRHLSNIVCLHLYRKTRRYPSSKCRFYSEELPIKEYFN